MTSPARCLSALPTAIVLLLVGVTVAWTFPRSDGFGRQIYAETYRGSAAPYLLSTLTTTTYDTSGWAVRQLHADGSSTTTTSYYAGGQRVAQAVNGVFSYLGSDGLGSAQTALDASGNVQASALYDPYGSVRYSDGTMPGSYGFTGQHADATTGLSYYNARYYDPAAGQFASADSVQDGLNRYAYVGGNPTTATDPSGHRMVCGVDCIGGGGPTCISDASCSGGWGQQPLRTKTTTATTSTATDHESALVTVVSASSSFDWVTPATYLATGLAMLAAGVVALGVAIANPELIASAEGLAAIFGGSPAAVFAGIATLITTGLSDILHGIYSIWSQVGIPLVAAGILTETMSALDTVASVVQVLWTLSSLSGLLGWALKLASLLIQMPSYVNLLFNALADGEQIGQLVGSR